MKYVVFSYDDGTVHDKRLIELMNAYHIKGTFNLNSGLAHYLWKLNDLDIERPDLNEVKSIYDGHEVAAHSVTHPHLDWESEERLHKEVFEDKKNLENIFNRTIEGFATPFGTYNEKVIEEIKKAGFKYCRLPEFTPSFVHEEDLFHLKVNALTFEDNLLQILERFVRDKNDDTICIIAGHSYEYYVDDSWDELEKVFNYINSFPSLKSVTLSEALKLTNRIK